MTTQLKRVGHGHRQDSVRVYKQLLRSILNQRPSGTRLRLAEKLGKNRSFVSQFSNPFYKTPIHDGLTNGTPTRANGSLLSRCWIV